jgi:cytochrome b6-f complex iron-sulfur subunit
MNRPSRRDFMKVTTTYLVGFSGLLGLAGIARYLSYGGVAGRETEFELGAAKSFPIGSRTRVDQIPALILREQAGFIAISLQCTHLGCTIEDAPQGFQCPCHGSRYDSQGKVTRGPARNDLPRLRAEVTPQGLLIVHTD